MQSVKTFAKVVYLTERALSLKTPDTKRPQSIEQQSYAPSKPHPTGLQVKLAGRPKKHAGRETNLVLVGSLLPLRGLLWAMNPQTLHPRI